MMLSSSVCTNHTSTLLGRVKEMACCSNTDYCNAVLSLSSLSQQLSSLEDTPTVYQGHGTAHTAISIVTLTLVSLSILHTDGQWLTWRVGTAIFSCFIAVVILAGLIIFVTVLYVQCQRKRMHTSHI